MDRDSINPTSNYRTVIVRSWQDDEQTRFVVESAADGSRRGFADFGRLILFLAEQFQQQGDQHAEHHSTTK